MFPWKILFRFFSATVLFATGGFAVGAELPVPFDVAPAEVAAPAPVADVGTPTTIATEVDPEVDPSTTTTTAAPEVIQIPVPLPVSVTEVTDPPADAVPATPAPTAPVESALPVGAPASAPAAAPPAVPVDADADADARSVCAAAKKVKACGPVIPAGDNSHAARVQRCQDWWNSLAQAFDQNNRPAWADRARAIAGRCEAMITRWEAAQERGDERRRDRPEKGDHNGDGHPDNGWRNKEDGGDRDRRGRGADDRPGPKPAGAKADKISRHSEGRQ